MFTAKRIALIAVATLLFVSGAAHAQSAPPNPPTNLGYWSDNHALTPFWTPSSSPGVTGYDVLLDGVDYGNVYGANAATTTLNGLPCDQTYTMSVVAFDSSGNRSSPATAAGKTGFCIADAAIVSNTPSVNQARVGQQVTFTIVAVNNGPDVEDYLLQVHMDVALNSLQGGVGPTCDRHVSPDGPYCEYAGPIYPGQTLTQTVVEQVQATGSQYASETTCANASGAYDPNPNNNCATGTVGIITTPPPPPAPLNQTPPTINGMAALGSVLTESHGNWTNSPTSFSYQWDRCNSTGSPCTAITGATGQLYTPTLADMGDTIRVQEWASNGSGTSGPANSALTAVVTAPTPGPTPTPTPTPTPAPTPPGVGPAPPGSSPPPVSGTGPVTLTTVQIKATLLAQLAPSGKAASIGALLATRGYTFWFNAPSRGRAVIDWYYVPAGARLSRALKPVLVATGNATFSKAGRTRLTMRLTATGSRMLKAAKRLKLTAKGTYTLPGGARVTARKTFRLSR